MPEQTPTTVTTATAWTLVSGDEHNPHVEAVIIGSAGEAREICKAQNIRRLEQALTDGARELLVWRVAGDGDLALLATSARVDIQRRRAPMLLEGDRVRVTDPNDPEIWRIGGVVLGFDGDLIVEVPVDRPQPRTVDTDPNRLEVTVRIAVPAEEWSESAPPVGYDGDVHGFATWVAAWLDSNRVALRGTRLPEPTVVVGRPQ